MKLDVVNSYKVLKKYLSNNEKFRHSIQVAIISSMIAKKWGVSVEEAMIAALLHDIGKSVDKNRMLSLCMQNDIEVQDFEVEEAPVALHGKISALFFKKEFEGNNPCKMNRIATAIENHVAGGMSMSKLSKILFIADNIKGKTIGIKMLDDIMSGRINNPNECVKRIIEDKIKRSQMKGRTYNPMFDATLKALGVNKEIER